MLARCAAIVAGLLVATGPGRATDWRSVVDHPSASIGRTITLGPAYCGGGGPRGADPGLYQCWIATGRLFVETRKLVASPAARTVDRECGGKDVWEHAPPCRFTARLVPRRFRSDPTLNPPGATLVIDTDRLDLR